MIRNLAINNIALIDSLEIDFNEGLTVLSGETGSGKSIIIDSLAFVLGDRADKTLIKHGKDSASVSALFDIENNDAVCQKLQIVKVNGAVCDFVAACLCIIRNFIIKSFVIVNIGGKILVK